MPDSSPPIAAVRKTRVNLTNRKTTGSSLGTHQVPVWGPELWRRSETGVLMCNSNSLYRPGDELGRRQRSDSTVEAAASS